MKKEKKRQANLYGGRSESKTETSIFAFESKIYAIKHDLLGIILPISFDTNKI